MSIATRLWQGAIGFSVPQEDITDTIARAGYTPEKIENHSDGWHFYTRERREVGNTILPSSVCGVLYKNSSPIRVSKIDVEPRDSSTQLSENYRELSDTIMENDKPDSLRSTIARVVFYWGAIELAIGQKGFLERESSQDLELLMTHTSTVLGIIALGGLAIYTFNELLLPNKTIEQVDTEEFTTSYQSGRKAKKALRKEMELLLT